MRYVRLIAGVIAGYATMALLITIVQESWLGGIGWYESPPGELAIGGFFTILSAVIGAMLGTVVAGGRTPVVGRVMSLLVVTETTVLTVQGRLDGPLWFDILAAAGLIVGILIGAEFIRRMPRRDARRASG